MKTALYWQLLVYFCASLLIGSVFAQTIAVKTVFTTGQYKNDQTNDETLGIPGADQLEVTIQGETEENYDFITLLDENNNRVGRLSGKLNKTLYVNGERLRVLFSADGRTVKSGVTVTITARTPSSILYELKSRLLAATNEILRNGTGEAYSKINNNLNEFRNLHTQIMQSQQTESVITQMANELSTLARDYRSISLKANDIATLHQQQLTVMEDIRKNIQSSISSLQRKRDHYQDLLNEARNHYRNSDLLEQQKLQFSITGYENILGAFSNQEAFWNDLLNIQIELIQVLEVYTARVQVLFHVLDISAQMYEQVSNVTALRKTTVKALENLTDLSNLRKVVDEIEKSELDILEHLERINQLDISA